MSNIKIAGPGMLKRKEEKTEANDKEWRNRRQNRINEEDAMEDKELPVDIVDIVDKELPVDIVDIELPVDIAIVDIVDIRNQPHQDHFTESDPALYMSNWHHLPDLAFDAIMMMVSLIDLRKSSKVCRSWKTKITKNILENRTKKNIIGARMERALGPGFEFPSAEEIRNAKWLCKYNLSLILNKNCLF